ncbi:hypothetical protein [Actinoplanes sp. DH11]|uniref:hypothetical protein n=1 Tax=Actinoplanes sp. DH11 TaxID=2857011 RepID=UPI001E471286|nr:hypothetical protein [Actinoplanes sp. DH11]
MTDTGASAARLARGVAASIALVGALAATGAATPAAAAAGPAVRGELLPIPAVAPGEQHAVSAVDVSPLGVVAGTARVTRIGPDGTIESLVETPYRWARLPRAGWQRQRLALPAGATSGSVSGLTDLGEPAGKVTLDGVTRAARWSLDGRHATLIGEARSEAGAVGPRGTWGVATAGPEVISGQAELVSRAGVRTPLSGTPELDAGYRRYVVSIGASGTALVSVFTGVGQGTTAKPVLWHDGATVQLPVFGTAYLGPACVSRVQADGSVVASGYSLTAGVPRYIVMRHVGGVPGTDVVLSQATQGQPVGGLICTYGQTVNNLAADGGVAGFLTDAGGNRTAAYWNAANQVTTVSLADGERAASGVAAARGGRMVILAETGDGGNRMTLWRNGTRTPLPAPAGWNVRSVVELTDAGLLIANVQDAAGTIRPAAWNLG